MASMPPIVRFLLAHAVAFGLTCLLARIPAVAGTMPGWGWVLTDACLACAGCVLLRLPWWWWPLALALPFAAAAPALPWWIWALGFAALLLIYGGGVGTRAPLYLSNRAAIRELAGLLPAQPGVQACDLGAGLGGPALGLAKQRPDAQITGVEASLLPWLVCRVRAGRRPNLHMRLGNIFTHDLSGYQLIYAFLSPEPMPRLWTKVCAEMQPGSLFVSNTFAVPGVEAERTIVLPGRSDARLLVYRVPGPKTTSQPHAN